MTNASEYRQKYLRLLEATGGIDPSVRPLVRAKRDVDSFNEIAAAINRMRQEFQPPRPQVTKNRRMFDETEVMVLSDLHFGKKVVIEGEVTFDKDIATDRFKAIVASMRHLNTSYMQYHSINELVVLLLGDLVDGELIYLGQPYNQDMPLIDQLIHAAGLIKRELIDPVSQEFETVRIVSVPGNHGEVRNDRGEHVMHPKTNMDTILALMLQMGCQDLKNVTFEVATTNMYTTTIRGWKFLLAHNLPSATQSAFRKKYGGFFERYRFDATIHGHWHTPEWTYFNTKPVVQNGSLPGVDDYSLDLAFNTLPLQIMFTVSDKRPIALRWEVDVGHRTKEAVETPEPEE